MEYGSEFDLYTNRPFRGDWTIPESWQLYRSGRDALKAFARLANRKKILLPALCCDSMILPFQLNGYDVSFYRLREDYSGDEKDVLEKLTDGAVLLYMRYFGIRPFSDAFLDSLRRSGRDILFLEDRTHDILIPRGDEGFHPDAMAASLRKWTALPEGGALETDLGVYPAKTDTAYGDQRLDAMDKKSRYLENGDETLHRDYMDALRRADHLLDESGEPIRMHEKFQKLLCEIDFAAILAARRRNLHRLGQRLAPLISDGTIRLMTKTPENSGLYLPILIENRDAVQRELIQRKLYLPAAIWPEPPEATGVCPVSHYVTEHMLSVLCDQRYTEADMDYQAENLMEILREGK